MPPPAGLPGERLGLRRPGDLPRHPSVLPDQEVRLRTGHGRTQGRHRLRVLAGDHRPAQRRQPAASSSRTASRAASQRDRLWRAAAALPAPVRHARPWTWPTTPGLEAAVAEDPPRAGAAPAHRHLAAEDLADVRLALEADPSELHRGRRSSSQILRAATASPTEATCCQLGGYLHDLGICLFFQDDPLLAKTVILKPDLGHDAVYQVLDDPATAGVARRLSPPRTWQRIWSDAAYESMHGELLQLMVKFGLCFQVPGSDTFIAPQLLTPSAARL